MDLLNLLNDDARLSLGEELLGPDGQDLARLVLPALAAHPPQDDPWVAAAHLGDRGRATNAVEDLLANRVLLLNAYGPQDVGWPINWFHAPAGDLQWPSHLCRHMWAAPLAQAWVEHRRIDCAERLADIMVDWALKFPVGCPSLDSRVLDWSRRYADRSQPPRTVEGYFHGYADGPWTALSAAVRVLNWTAYLRMTADSGVWNNRRLSVVLESLLVQHRQLLIDFPRQMNQYLATSTALIHMGLYYSMFSVAPSALELGWRRASHYAQLEVYTDGSMAECSPNYGLDCAERLADLARLAQRFGRPAPPEITCPLREAATYFIATRTPMGPTTRLAKGGKDPAPLLAKVRQLGQQVDEQPPLSAAFRWAGHFVARSDRTPQATWLLFDAGPRGSGHHDLACLNLHLISRGCWLLTDSGYYTYSNADCDRPLNNYMPSTAAHNCGLVDGLGQRVVLNTELCRPNSAPGYYHFHDDGETVIMGGRYEGGFGPQGELRVAHARRIVFCRREATVLVEDAFEPLADLSPGRHAADLHWQLPPGVRWQVDGCTVRVAADAAQGRPAMTLECSAGNGAHPDVAVFQGRQDPMLGWHAIAYGQVTPSPVVRVRSQGPLPLTFRTRISIM
jgi:hypothetical protein